MTFLTGIFIGWLLGFVMGLNKAWLTTKQPDHSKHPYNFFVVAFVLLALAIVSTLCSCAHLPITDPKGPPAAAVYDKTGFTIPREDYDHLRAEGVPDGDFVKTATGYHVSNLAWHDIHSIQLNRANPVPKGAQ